MVIWFGNLASLRCMQGFFMPKIFLANDLSVALKPIILQHKHFIFAARPLTSQYKDFKIMRQKIHLRSLLLVFVVLWGLSACEIECEDPSNNLVRIKFFKASNLEPDTLAFLEVRGVGEVLPFPDSLLYTQQDTLSVFELPTATSNPSIQYQFKRLLSNGNTVERSLTLNYKVIWEIIRPNCGLNAVITQLNFLETTFDSVAVVKSTLSNDPQEIHLHIFD